MATEEVIHQSWGNRLMESIRGVLFGIVLFLGSFLLLVWNEGRAVRTYRNLTEVRHTAVEATVDTVSPAHEGKPLHLTGETATDAELTDPRFGVSVNAIQMRRRVEMYQWEEERDASTQKKLGGSTDKKITYTYRKIWSGQPINSGAFKQPGHDNPPVLPFDDWKAHADRVTLGSFQISPGLIQRMDFFEIVEPRNPTLPDGVRVEGPVLYKGGSPADPQIGDVRITLEAVTPGPVSVVAAQQGATLVPWTTSRGTPYARIQAGTHSLEAMMEAAEKENRILTWILRGAGWLVMSLGIGMVLKPMAVLGDVVPLIGNLAETGIGLVSGLISLTLTLVTIAFAWIAVRPLVGIPLLVLAAGLVAGHFVRLRNRGSARSSA